MRAATIVILLLWCSLAGGHVHATEKPPTLKGAAPIVIAHRGASGYLPEHTLAAYDLAIAQGADFIEPDLVVTRDGVLIVRHEPMLGATTDVASRPEFAGRKTTRQVDGVGVTDWFASDFTLSEIKTLRARQAMPERDQSMNGRLPIPTLGEVIELAKTASARLKRSIGIYPETKHPTYHVEIGLPLEDLLLAALDQAGWTGPEAPVIIQSFEVANLQYLRSRTKVRLVQLVGADGLDKDGGIVLKPPNDKPYDFKVSGDPRTYKDMVSTAGLAGIATYADGVAPWKSFLLPSRHVDGDRDGAADDLNGDGKMDERDRILIAPSDVVAKAHAAGLFVHTWTFRNEARRLVSSFQGDPALEYRAVFEMGVDGVFTDFPDTAIGARQ